MTKYKEYFDKMLADNKELFDAFRQLHANYSLDQDKWQEKFNKDGEKIMEVIREWEDRLCRQTEKGGYSQYSGGLAEKFQNEVRKEFPLIDSVGIIISSSPPAPEFNIRKITL